MKYASVIVDIASSQVDKVFDYIVPSGVDVKMGMRVLVPFGPRAIEGIIVKLSDKTEVTTHKLKQIIRPLDGFPVITAGQFLIADFLKENNHIGLADSFRLFLPSEMRSGKIKDLVTIDLYIENEDAAKEYLSTLKSNATSQRGVIEALLEHGTLGQVGLNKKFGASATNKLKNEGIISARERVVLRSPYKGKIPLLYLPSSLLSMYSPGQ